MTEIQIPDPDPDPEPSSALAGPAPVDGEGGAGSGPGETPGGPYRNLLVPLVVVPALIVMVLVLVYALFGAILGDEVTPRDNVDKLIHGGINEREQAAFSLVRQFLEAHQEGHDASAWDLDPELLPDIRRAYRASSDLEGPSDVAPHLALTLLLVWMGDAEGVEHLAELLRLGDDLDPGGVFRSYAAYALGNFGERFDPREQRIARAALLELLESPDRALRVVAAGALQTLPGPETVEALRGLLNAPDLDLRGTAALSLAQLDDPAGAAVLTELALSTAPYEAERAQDPEGRRWTKARDVSESRRKALAALFRLHRLPPREELLRMAEDDPDGDVRALARELLAEAEDR